MPASLCKPSLSLQVLTLLKEHGPVSIELLHQMTEPPAEKKNLRQSLGLLKKKGLIESVSFNAQTSFYTIRTINAISGSVPSYPPPRPAPFSQEIAESLENKYYIPSEIDRNQAC